MKKSLLFAFTAICSVGSAAAFDVEVDGIAYNKLSEDEKTLEVTFHTPAADDYSKPTGGY